MVEFGSGESHHGRSCACCSGSCVGTACCCSEHTHLCICRCYNINSPVSIYFTWGIASSVLSALSLSLFFLTPLCAISLSTASLYLLFFALWRAWHFLAPHFLFSSSSLSLFFILTLSYVLSACRCIVSSDRCGSDICYFINIHIRNGMKNDNMRCPAVILWEWIYWIKE